MRRDNTKITTPNCPRKWRDGFDVVFFDYPTAGRLCVLTLPGLDVDEEPIVHEEPKVSAKSKKRAASVMTSRERLHHIMRPKGGGRN